MQPYDNGHPYTPMYCEENIYHLARDHPDAFVVFISNRSRQVLFFANTALLQAGAPEGLVLWDYHVILVDFVAELVWDYDSAVPFPCALMHYLARVLQVHRMGDLMPDFRRLFRVIKASSYVADFASDRSHMLMADCMTYFSPPPPYQPIVSQTGETMNMRSLFIIEEPTPIDDEKALVERVMQCDELVGTVCTESAFCRLCITKHIARIQRCPPLLLLRDAPPE